MYVSLVTLLVSLDIIDHHMPKIFDLFSTILIPFRCIKLAHLKSYEIEAVQLRGVTHELQKAIRATARENDNLRLREKLFEEEIRTLKQSKQVARVSVSWVEDFFAKWN